MTIDQMLHIEGLDEFTDHDLSVEDTPPDAIIVTFKVEKEYMPFLSAQQGKRVYKNFIHRHFIKELGFSSGSRRIKDDVYFDEGKGWRVKKLAPPGQSDIKKFTKEWNAFVRGTENMIEGSPIELLFKIDPSRADMYARSHITTIERLAGLTEADCQRGGMGWLDDKKRAEAYLKKAEEASGGIKNVEYIKQLEAKLAATEAESADLKAKFEAFLSSQIEAKQQALTPKKGKGKTKVSEEDLQNIEGLES